MARPIKFRVWDDVRAQFIYSDNRDLETQLFRLQDFFAECYNLGHYDVYLQQFTGLLDKNNKEIYEGDILFWTAEQMMANNTPMIYKNEYRAIVEYSAPSFILETLNDEVPVFWGGCEVIGNVFENPDLLK